MDAEGNLDMFLLAAVILVAVLRARRRQARPQHNSVLTDWLYYAEIVATEYVNKNGQRDFHLAERKLPRWGTWRFRALYRGENNDPPSCTSWVH
jgi:hypothetical protein